MDWTKLSSIAAAALAAVLIAVPPTTVAAPAYAVPRVGGGSMVSATFSLNPYYSASATSGGGVPWSSREKESQHEDESIDGHGRWCSGSLGRWCYVDRTIGLGW
jgi:hypothetical protein